MTSERFWRPDKDAAQRKRKEGIWAEIAAPRSERRKEGAAKEQPLPTHILLQVEQQVKMMLGGAADA